MTFAPNQGEPKYASPYSLAALQKILNILVIILVGFGACAHAQSSNTDPADQECTKGNYTCDYGEQPPQGEEGPCMLNKQCSPTDAGENVKGICEAEDTCRATLCNGQACTKPNNNTDDTGSNDIGSYQPSYEEG